MLANFAHIQPDEGLLNQMARKSQKKWIYRDKATGRLIPKQTADERDPSTWTQEEFLDELEDDELQPVQSHFD